MPLSPPDPTNPPGSSPEDAEAAFNTWLDSRFVESGPTPPEHPHSDHPEVIAAHSLQALAAEEDAALALATAARPWKEILVSSQPLAATPEVLSARAPRRPSRFGSTINRLVSIAAVLAVLLAGFATAWVARDRFGSDNDAPLLQIAASPSTTVTCTTRTLSQEEVDRLVADYKKQPKPTLADYALNDKPVSKADAEAAIATYRASRSCPAGEPDTNSLRWETSTSTKDAIAAYNLSTNPGFMADSMAAYRTLLEPASRILTPLSPADYIVDSNDPAIKPYVFFINAYAGSIALLPDHFVTLADGRIGAPAFIAIPGGVSAYKKDLSVLRVSFMIFKQVDGQWLIDDGLGLCPGDCTVAKALIDAQIAKYRRLATVIGSPVASPESMLPATPAASPKP
jgi:hypothetical protein